MSAKITIVVAMNKDNVIGVKNQLPWHIPEDLAHFKQLTLNKPIIMGRKTFESIGRVLPSRKNIVITRNPSWQHAGVTVFSNLTAAIAAHSECAEICVIGGGEIYTDALSVADTLQITMVDKDIVNPDTFFPQVDYTKWQIIHNCEFTSQNGIHCTFSEYRRH